MKMLLIKWPLWSVSGGDRFDPSEEDCYEMVKVSEDEHYREPFNRANSYHEAGQYDLAQKLLDEALVREVELDPNTLSVLSLGPLLNNGKA